MGRPRIKIEPDTADLIVEVIGAIFLLLMVGFPWYYFNELPEIIPVHYNTAGEPDGFSQKIAIWTLPGITLAIYLGMLILNNFPHILNYLKKITEENAEQQYRLATKLLRTLRMLIAVSFFYIVYRTIQVSMNNADGLGTYFLPIFITVMFGTVAIYSYQALRK